MFQVLSPLPGLPGLQDQTDSGSPTLALSNQGNRAQVCGQLRWGRKTEPIANGEVRELTVQKICELDGSITEIGDKITWLAFTE